MRLWLDTETYSETPIGVGTYNYVADTELMVVTWAVDDGPVRVWDVTARDHHGEDFALALATVGNEIWAHNAQFDRLVIAKHFPHISPDLNRWRCTMAQAYAHSLPGGLEELGEVLGLPADQAKLKDGRALVQLFCKPRPKNMKLRRATRETHPAEWARFLEYAANDIVAMREIHKRLPKWNYEGAELALWHLDQRINDRGFAVDGALVEGALAVTDREKVRLAERASDLTDGEVASTTKRDALLSHLLEEYGVNLPNLQADTVERFLEKAELPDGLRELLTVRLQATTTSVAKYRKLKSATSADGRLRGTTQWCGAARTGRDAHRGFQPGNLPRPDMVIDELIVESIKNGTIDLVYDDVMGVCSDALRGAIIAPPGRKLVVSDLSNIEGRDQAWLAGEQWKLDAFRAFDAGQGPDLYKASYGKSFNVDPSTVDKAQRQIGKVQELMLGYEGGVGAYITGAATYHIDLDELAAKAEIPADVWDDTEWLWSRAAQNKRTYGLSEEVYRTCDALKRMWRAAHPNIESMWLELKLAALNAIDSPGLTVECRKLKLRRDGAWLRIVLPSGRALCYPQPRIVVDEHKRSVVTYMGRNQYTRRWERLKTYGGKLFENVCQAVARDILFYHTPEIESRGYGVVLKVHDEVVTECNDLPTRDHIELSNVISTPHAWCADLPLAAAGFEAHRYKKD